MSPDADLPLPGPMPEPSVDPPEPAHPDDLDTITPGLTDESGLLDDDRKAPVVEADDDGTSGAGEHELAGRDITDTMAVEEPTA